MAGKKNWIAGAIKKPGSLRATAKRDGMIKGDQKISQADISKLEHSKSEKTRRRAELAHVLAGFHKKQSRVLRKFISRNANLSPAG